MAASLCLLVDRGPYGSIQAGEGLRHALGAAGKGWEVVLALTGDGVLLALPGQSPPAGQWPSLSDAVAELLAGGNGRGHVLVDVEALEGRGLGERDVIPGCRPVTPGEIARTLARCERTLIF